jgi:hypothetical protein
MMTDCLSPVATIGEHPSGLNVFFGLIQEIGTWKHPDDIDSKYEWFPSRVKRKGLWITSMIMCTLHKIAYGAVQNSAQ